MFAAAENKHENKSYPFLSHYDFFYCYSSKFKGIVQRNVR